MNILVINKPHPHCEIPEGHPLYAGYIPAERTDIRRTFAKHAPHLVGDDYDHNERTAHLDLPGEFA